MAEHFTIPGHGAAFRDSRGLWTLVIELPPSGGNRQRKYLRSKTKQGLLRKVEAFDTIRRNTGELPGISPTVEQWMQRWLTDIAAREVRPKTLSNYRSMSKHIINHLGKTRLEQLSASSIRGLYDEVTKQTSSTTALTVHRILSSSLTAAVREGKLDRNLTELVRPPRRNRVTLQTLTTDEAIRLIRMFGEDEGAYLWATFLLTGARRGEILGLEWERVTDVIDLSWQLQRHQADMSPPADYEHRHLGRGLYLTRPKSAAGVRIVPLFEPLKGILDRWRQVAPSNPHGLVFAMPDDGRPIDPDYASRKWKQVLQSAGIHRNVRLHDLRHTTVDLLYEAGVDEDVIRDVVGHSTRIMTRSYRSRASKARLEIAMEPFSQLVAGMPRAVGE